MNARPLVFGGQVALGLAVFLIAGASLLADERWLVLERSSTPTPEVVSVVRALPEPQVRGKYPVLLEIAWGYRGLPNGMPTDQELVYARTLYTSIDAIVGKSGFRAMTRTGDGGRTIYYYVSDAVPLRDAIREFFDSQPPISVKVSAREEPDWNTVREVLDAVRR